MAEEIKNNEVATVNENVAAAPAPAPAPAAPAPAAEPVQENKIKNGKYADYTDHDLQSELLRYQKKTAKRTTAVAVALGVIALIFAVSAALIVPEVINTLTAVQNSLEEVSTLAGKAEDTLENLNTSLVGMNKMIDNVDTVLTDNTDAMSEAVNKISNIDIDSLNESIQDLNSAVDSMGKLFNRGF